MGVCNCSMFCCTFLYVHSSIVIILMRKRELVALPSLSSLCLVMVERLFLVVPRGCLRFVIVVFPDHTHLLFLPTVPVNKKNRVSSLLCIFNTTIHCFICYCIKSSATHTHFRFATTRNYILTKQIATVIKQIVSSS